MNHPRSLDGRRAPVPGSAPAPGSALWAARLFAVGLCAATLAGCAGMQAPRSATATPACQDVSFPIYFAEGSDQLSDPARQAIVAGRAQVQSQAQARRCAVSEVDVFGLASAPGPADANLALSKRRATIVAQALVDAGLPRPLFDVQGLGESGARTARGAPAMLQRKTVVVIHVAAAS